MWKTRAVAALVVTPGALGTLETWPSHRRQPAADDAVGGGERRCHGRGRPERHHLFGSAANGNFGQSRTISFGRRRRPSNYTRTIDFTQPASHASGDPIPPAVRGGPPPQPGAPGSYSQLITPANAAWAQQLQIWVTPWGFLRGAAASTNATLRTKKVDEIPYRIITWSPAQKAPSGSPAGRRLHQPRNLVDAWKPGSSTRCSATCTSSCSTGTTRISAG
jgi:hypothetical protein